MNWNVSSIFRFTKRLCQTSKFVNRDRVRSHSSRGRVFLTGLVLLSLLFNLRKGENEDPDHQSFLKIETKKSFLLILLLTDKYLTNSYLPKVNGVFQRGSRDVCGEPYPSLGYFLVLTSEGSSDVQAPMSLYRFVCLRLLTLSLGTKCRGMNKIIWTFVSLMCYFVRHQ